MEPYSPVDFGGRQSGKQDRFPIETLYGLILESMPLYEARAALLGHYAVTAAVREHVSNYGTHEIECASKTTIDPRQSNASGSP
jgi:hypothetical protein